MAGALNRFYHWQAAFVAFCNGVPEDEIAAAFCIPYDKLKQRMSEECWSGLREKLPIATVPQAGAVATGEAPGLPARVNARLKMVEENRAENLRGFAKLREHALEMITAMQEKRLMLKKHFFAAKAGQVVEKEVEPGPGDWVNVATYLRTIADGTYRALGDFQGQEKPGQDASAGATMPQAPAITIILPGAIATPRSAEPNQAQVIDLRTLTDENPAK